MYLSNLLCILGILYIVDALNKHSYKLLPKITIPDFFVRKLGIKSVFSLKDYVIAHIKIYVGLKKIGSIKESDISESDAAALDELKQYMGTEIKQYTENLMVDSYKMVSYSSSHIQCQLVHGKLDFHLVSRKRATPQIVVRFESFSEDKPTLEISNFGSSYTYNIKSKFFRFINPDIAIISDIEQIVDEMSRNAAKTISLQAVA